MLICQTLIQLTIIVIGERVAGVEHDIGMDYVMLAILIDDSSIS